MTAMRVACYARYSTDLQRDTSLDDQLRVCREFAEREGWTVLAEQVYTDAAVSGTSLERPGIQALLAAAAQPTRPFDVVLADDSSRVARDLPDALRVLQILTFHGCRVIYVAQQIDSASEQAETLVMIRGLVDGLYVRDLRAKIQRGLAGQLERGYATGSVTYGYRTVPVPDPSGARDLNGNPTLVGKRVEVVPAEAAIIVRIFEAFADGQGIGRIVAGLNREGVPSPRGRRAWRPGAVKRLMLNERYRGRLIWGQRTWVRRPGSRLKVARAIPRAQWRVNEQPHLRIVSEALWAQVEARRAAIRAVLPAAGVRLMRGRHAALYSRYLFAGHLRCATCGRAMTIVAGGHGSPRYGCPTSWRAGETECQNRLTIRARVADPRLLECLQAALCAPTTVQHITEQLTTALNQHVQDGPRLQAEMDAARTDLQHRLNRLLDALERGAVTVADVSERLTTLRAELAQLEARQATLQGRLLPQRLAVIPAWVQQRLTDLVGTLQASTERAKREFQRLGVRVTLAPIRPAEGRPFYRATIESGLPELSGAVSLTPSAVGRLSVAPDAASEGQKQAEICAWPRVDRSDPR